MIGPAEKHAAAMKSTLAKPEHCFCLVTAMNAKLLCDEVTRWRKLMRHTRNTAHWFQSQGLRWRPMSAPGADYSSVGSSGDRFGAFCGQVW